MQINLTTGMAVDNKKVSAMDFYAYRIMMRTGANNHILRCRQLFHQFLVDMYPKIESERLWFIRLNKKRPRVDEYIYLRDAVMNDGNIDNITQDAMTYVRNYGRPDLFMTFTCNPK